MSEPMNKRTATISFRVSPELEARLQATANARNVTLSDLMNQVAVDFDEHQAAIFLKLQAAYGPAQDLSGLQKDLEA
jgi:predicted HicB family RNase H-like nuclease